MSTLLVSSQGEWTHGSLAFFLVLIIFQFPVTAFSEHSEFVSSVVGAARKVGITCKRSARYFWLQPVKGSERSGGWEIGLVPKVGVILWDKRCLSNSIVRLCLQDGWPALCLANWPHGHMARWPAPASPVVDRATEAPSHTHRSSPYICSRGDHRASRFGWEHGDTITAQYRECQSKLPTERDIHSCQRRTVRTPT